jgi:translation elongation factor EF-G
MGIFDNPFFKKTEAATAQPSLLPIVNLECVVESSVPEEFEGAIIEELNKRKVKIVAEQTIGKFKTICCEVRLAEMFNYGSTLRSKTQGRASFSIQPKFYEQVSNWSEKDKEQLRELFNKVSS